jgi:hypothetical protein
VPVLSLAATTRRVLRLRIVFIIKAFVFISMAFLGGGKADSAFENHRATCNVLQAWKKGNKQVTHP